MRLAAVGLMFWLFWLEVPLWWPMLIPVVYYAVKGVSGERLTKPGPVR